MTSNLKAQSEALKTFLNAMLSLRDAGILLNKKDFTGQIGEWLVENIYDGKRAISGIQKGWDVIVGDKYIQVKSHAKAEGNKNRWSAVDVESSEKIDELVIVVFSHDYKLKEFYNVPWGEAVPHMKPRGKKKKRSEINWSAIEKYRVPIENLPNQQVVSLFI